MEKGALVLDAGHDGFDSDFFAIGENDAGDSAVFEADVLDFGIGADFSACLFRRFDRRGGDGAESAARKRGRAYGMGVGGGAQKKDSGRSGGPGAKRSAKNAASSDDGAKQFCFEEFRDEIRDGHGTPAEKIEDAGFSKAANAAAGLDEIPKILGSGLVYRGRRDGSELRKEAGGFFERCGKLGVFGGVLGGNTGNFAGGFNDVIVEKERVAIRRWREDTRVGRENFTIEFIELHIAGNVGAERAESVRESGGAEAGMKFIGDGAAADHFAAFEDEGLEAAFGEIESGNESVVTAADKSHALSDGQGQLARFETCDRELEPPDFHPFKMTWLAMRPLAPMMPPPGWVAEPHI